MKFISSCPPMRPCSVSSRRARTSWDRVEKIRFVRCVASGFDVFELGNWSGFEALGDKTPCFAAAVDRFWPRF